MLDWIENRQTVPLKTISFERRKDDIFTNQEFDDLLRKFHPTQSLSVYANAPKDFRFTGTLPKTDGIHVQLNVPWINIDCLLTMNTIQVIIWGSKFSIADINTFLKRWVTGGFSRLEYIEVELENSEHFVFDNFHEDLRDKVVEINEYRYIERGFHGIEIHLQDGYSIRQEGGMTATINTSAGRFCMVVWKGANLN